MANILAVMEIKVMRLNIVLYKINQQQVYTSWVDFITTASHNN